MKVRKGWKHKKNIVKLKLFLESIKKKDKSSGNVQPNK